MVIHTDQAWVTLVTNDSYCLGALVLAHSLRKAKTRRVLHCMVAPGVSKDMRANLDYVYDVVTDVDVMESGDAEKLHLIQRPDLGITFTKLHCWKLTQYKKCVFLDADCMVLQNSDELFDYPELSAAPDIGWPDIFNSGVFIFEPSESTYKKIITMAMTEGSFDGGDQGILNAFFYDWLTKGPSHRLPFVYNTASSALYTYIAALRRFGKDVKIVHFLGPTKPWMLLTDENLARGAKSDKPESEFMMKWLQLFGERVLSSLDPSYLSARTVHPMKTPEDGQSSAEPPPPTVRTWLDYCKAQTIKEMPSGSAISDDDRQRAWEEGVVDYTGHDSWENIQKRLDESLKGDTDSK